DFEVENPSITQGQRAAFVLEAAQTGLQVSFEQTAPPDRAVPGYVNALFGTTATLAAAERLRLKVAGVGFRYLDVVYSGPRAWRVLAPHLPVSSEAAFRAEVRKAKLSVTFVKK